MSMKSTVKKRCSDSQCPNPDKTLSDFHRNRTKVDGHNSICKECQARRDAARRERMNQIFEVYK